MNASTKETAQSSRDASAIVPLRRDGSFLILRLLSPLERFYGETTTIEVRMTRPEVVTVDRRGVGKKSFAAPDLTLGEIESVCRALSNRHGLKFDADTHPKISCVLPGDHRFECLLGSSVRSGISLAIRCKHGFVPTWDQVAGGSEVKSYLVEAVRRERNIIVSGVTNTGKTTLLNMLLGELPDERRVIAVEDTPELHLDRFWDGGGLLAERETSGASGLLDWRQLYDHVVRVTPDHIVFGEISTLNAFAALAALNSGVTGFMCTIHAESPHQAINRKFERNIAWSGQNMPRVPEFISELVDVVVQIKRSSDGWRRITDVYEPRANRFFLKDGELSR